MAGTLADRFREYRKPLEARIQRAVDSGELRPADPNLVLNPLNGMVAIPFLYDVELPKESDAESIVDQVLMGLAIKQS